MRLFGGKDSARTGRRGRDRAAGLKRPHTACHRGKFAVEHFSGVLVPPIWRDISFEDVGDLDAGTIPEDRRDHVPFESGVRPDRDRLPEVSANGRFRVHPVRAQGVPRPERDDSNASVDFIVEPRRPVGRVL